jgi:hypothetical protein
MMSPFSESPSDTSPEAERIYIELLREAPPWRKAAIIESLTRACQELAVSGIHMRFPRAGVKEIRMRLAALWMDRDTMMRVFGWDPEREGY